MTRSRKLIALSIAAALSLSAGGSRLWAEEAIATYEGSRSNVNIKGHLVTVVQVELKSNGSRVVLAVPNDEVKGKAPVPHKAIAVELAKLLPGAIVKVDAGMGPDLGMTLNTIEPYDTKPGEDNPNGYIFSKTFEKPGKVPQTQVVLTKFGKEFTFLVPLRKGEKGEMEQDPDIMAAIGKLQEGGSVWVKSLGGRIVLIEPYTAPAVGKLVKIGTTDVDGHKVPSADVELENGKTVTLFIPVKENGKTFTPDPMVSMQLHKFRVNSSVQFIAHEDGDKMWLREISAGPKPTTPPAVTPPAK